MDLDERTEEHDKASMRPRGLPRGCLHRGRGRELARHPARFNEAAGITPRMLKLKRPNGDEYKASMRPRGLPRGCA